MIKYHRASAALGAYEVERRLGRPGKPEVIGYVRKSQNGPGWAYALDLDGPWTWIQHSTRHEATNHLLSAYSPMAAWLV